MRAEHWFTKDDKRHGYLITDRVEHSVLEALDRVATGIGDGVFPAHPSDRPTWGWVDCWYCTPDGLNDHHIRRDWERKRDDPALTRTCPSSSQEPTMTAAQLAGDTPPAPPS